MPILPQMGRHADRQALRSSTTREHIVQAAVMLFALKGIGATSMDDICLAAGCSKGGLYHHFKGKRDVVSASVRRLQARDALLPPIVDGGDEGLPGVNGLGRVLIELWAAAAKDEVLRDQLATAYATIEPAGGDGARGGLAQLLQIGALVEDVTREAVTDPAEAARRLGIDEAA